MTYQVLRSCFFLLFFNLHPCFPYNSAKKKERRIQFLPPFPFSFLAPISTGIGRVFSSFSPFLFSLFPPSLDLADIPLLGAGRKRTHLQFWFFVGEVNYVKRFPTTFYFGKKVGKKKLFPFVLVPHYGEKSHVKWEEEEEKISRLPNTRSPSRAHTTHFSHQEKKYDFCLQNYATENDGCIFCSRAALFLFFICRHRRKDGKISDPQIGACCIFSNLSVHTCIWENQFFKSPLSRPLRRRCIYA